MTARLHQRGGGGGVANGLGPWPPLPPHRGTPVRAPRARLPRLPRVRARALAQHARGLPLRPAAVRRATSRAGVDALAVDALRPRARFVAELAPGTTERPPVAPATLQRKVACLRSFYRHLRRQGVLEDDPTRGPARAARRAAAAARPQPRRGRPAARAAEGHRAGRAARPRAAGADVRLRAARLGGDRPRGSATSTSRPASCAPAARAPRSGSCRSAGGGRRASTPTCERGRPQLVGDRLESRLFVNHRGGGPHAPGPLQDRPAPRARPPASRDA